MIFAWHYFLWFSALTSIYGYLSVYAKNYANVSPQMYGILNMWLPFMSMVAKPVFCSLADHYQAYRTFFIIFLGMALVGWGSFGVLPFFIDIPNANEPIATLYVGNWITICIMTFVAYLSMSVICCLGDAFAVNQGKRAGSSYGKIRVFGTIGWGISAIVVAYINEYDKLPILVPGLLLTIFCLTLDLVIVVLWQDRSAFKLDKPLAAIDSNDDQHQTVVVSGKIDHHGGGVEFGNLNSKLNNNKQSAHQTNNAANGHRMQQIRLKNAANNSGGDHHQLRGAIYSNKSFVSDSGEQLSLPVMPSILPPSYDSLDDQHQNTTINSDKQQQQQQQQQQPISNCAGGGQPIKSRVESSRKIISLRLQLLMLYMVINTRRSLIRFMILFTLSGLLSSMQWVYFFLYLEEIYKENFTYISSLSMVGQSFLGELPFFIISQRIIDLIGRSNALSLSIASIACRYLLYIFLLPNVSMYFVVLVEALQGPSFGLFYVVMTDIGMDYSNCDDVIVKLVETNHIANNPDDIQVSQRALRATMQGLVSGCYEGLGLGLGSVIGGYVIDKLGFYHLWLGSAVLALASALINCLVETI